MSLPKALTYQTIKPKGFSSSFKRWPVQTQTSFKTYAQDEIIKFKFMTDDYIDPYQSYLEMEIEFDPKDYEGLHGNFDPLGTGTNATNKERCDAKPTFHLDGPSTSLISQLIIYSNQKEVERIQEYDQVGYLLSDLNTNLACRLFKAFEGYHYERAPDQLQSNHYNSNSFKSTVPYLANPSTPEQIGSYGSAKGNSPLTGQLYATSWGSHYPGSGAFQQLGNFDIHTQQFLNTNQNEYNATISGSFPGLRIEASNAVTHFDVTKTFGSIFYKQLNTGVFGNYYYMDRFPKLNYALANCQNDTHYGISGQDSQFGGLYGVISTNQTDIPTTEGILSPSYTSSQSYMKSNSHNGYHRPIGAGQSYNKTDFLSPFFPHMNIVNGKFVTTQYTAGWNKNEVTSTEQQFTTTRKKFFIPILSGIIGQLIPRDEWRLVPGKGLGEMLFEFKVNPYAFFASGVNFSKLDQVDGTNMNDMSSINYQFPMRWKVTNVRMMFDLWSFDDAVNNQVNAQLQSTGIHFTSQGFSQGPKYQISNTPAVRNNWHINNGIRSLRGIYFWFLDDRYQKYSTCRKQYRLSHNMKKIQLKIAQNYIPQQPIQGNAGCLGQNSYIRDDLTEFYAELQRCTGTFFDCMKPMNITADQYAVNDRPYNPDNLSHVYGQMGIFHEERCRGQAIYGFDLLSDPSDRTVRSGIDTTESKPIELITEPNSGGDFTESSTMYIMLHHDFLVEFRLGFVQTAGAG